MTLDIDLGNPSVRELLGESDAPRLATGSPRRELVQIAGDQETGITQRWDMGAGKQEVQVTYKDFVLTVDVYRVPGEPMKVHLICPRCKHHLQVSAERKQIDFDPKAGDPKLGGRLNIEPFECTWELPDAGEHKVGLVSGGLTLCKWRVGISNNVARDA